MTDGTEEGEGYESGPFCVHYGDPADCEACAETCACGCRGSDHAYRGDGFRECKVCNCVEFKNKEVQMGEQTMEELKRRLLAARIELAGRKIAAAGRAFGEGCDKDGDGLLMEGVRLLLDREANSSEQAARR